MHLWVRGGYEVSVNRPAWSLPPREPSAPKKKPQVMPGLRFVSGAKAWCYLCNSEHRFAEPHKGAAPVLAEDVEMSICKWCSKEFPTRGDHGNAKRYYCTADCRNERIKARKRQSWAGRATA